MGTAKDQPLDGAGKRRHHRADDTYASGAGNVDASAWMALIRKAPSADPRPPADPREKPDV